MGLPANYSAKESSLDASQLEAIRGELKPYMLRRMKEDVETIPAKEEVVMWIQQTWEQRTYYRAIYEGQAHVVMAGNNKKNLPNMRNLAMELRKVCNHPFMSTGVEDDYRAKRLAAVPPGAAPPTELQLLTQSCGKMVLMGKLLPKLRAEGKKARSGGGLRPMSGGLLRFLAGGLSICLPAGSAAASPRDDVTLLHLPHPSQAPVSPPFPFQITRPIIRCSCSLSSR